MFQQCDQETSAVSEPQASRMAAYNGPWQSFIGFLNSLEKTYPVSKDRKLWCHIKFRSPEPVQEELKKPLPLWCIAGDLKRRSDWNQRMRSGLCTGHKQCLWKLLSETLPNSLPGLQSRLITQDDEEVSPGADGKHWDPEYNDVETWGPYPSRRREGRSHEMQAVTTGKQHSLPRSRQGNRKGWGRGEGMRVCGWKMKMMKDEEQERWTQGRQIGSSQVIVKITDLTTASQTGFKTK